ncbi:XK-related protein 7 isoform X3 [Rhipicephalus microplus]|uniref:XK-related protein 7 isoform X3 n=1 Tax=Rhipicephalus microplus TaxID=6941 RepID=UPI003F6D2E6F
MDARFMPLQAEKEDDDGLDTKELRYRCCRGAWAVISLVLFASSLVADAHLSYQYGLNSHYAYCSITLAILIVPTVTLNVLSFGWHKQDGGTSSATIIAALIQLGMFHRHCQVLWLSIGKVSKNLEALHTMEKKTADLRLLHLYEVFLKSALQISFQIYLIYDTDAWNKFTVVSVSLSFLSLCWAVIEYDVATWRLKHKNKTELVCSMIIHELGRVIVVLSRIVAMAMMMIADDGNAPFIFIANYALTLVFVILMNKVEAILPSEGWMCWIHHITATAAFNFSFIDVGDSSFRTLRILVYANGMLQNGECVSEFFHERLNHGAQLHAYVGWGVLVSFAVGAGLIWLCLWKGEMLPGHCYLFPNKETTDSEVCPVPWTVASQPLGTEGQGLTHYCPLLHICNTHVRALPIARILMHRHLGATFVVSAVFKMAASMSSSSSANKELGIQVSETTAKRHSAEAGLRMRVACHKPLLQKPNHAKWLQFARDHEPWTTSDWEKVVFTGETSFTTRWNLRQEAWRPENSRYSPKYPLEVAASDRSAVFVWGLVTKEGLGPLVLIKDTYTSECYCSILDDVMVPYLSEGPFPEGDYILQQNNSPVHRSRKVTTFLENRGINILSWPPQSPDLNIIESVWDLMKTALQSRSLHGVSADDLWEAINEEWERLRSDRSLTADLYNSLPSIMAAVVTANEEATR